MRNFSEGDWGFRRDLPYRLFRGSVRGHTRPRETRFSLKAVRAVPSARGAETMSYVQFDLKAVYKKSYDKIFFKIWLEFIDNAYFLV
jgi:hypothetical protein